jgi:hypothetical protein
MSIQYAAVAAVQGDVMLIALSSILHSAHVMKIFLLIPNNSLKIQNCC